MHLVSYLRDGDRVFETYWTTYRGVEAMDYSYALMDLTVYKARRWALIVAARGGLVTYPGGGRRRSRAPSGANSPA
jgi:hypothetical protein